jgi:hypothetical protein
MMAVAMTTAPVAQIGEEERCEVCRCFIWRDIDPVAAERALRAGIPVNEGTCRRYPTPVSKRRSDWCGEFRAGS